MTYELWGLNNDNHAVLSKACKFLICTNSLVQFGLCLCRLQSEIGISRRVNFMFYIAEQVWTERMA